MNFKKISTCLLIIPLAMQLASCKNISPRPLSTLTPTATAVPSETPTPQPTGTNTVSPTPEITLIGLESDLSKFPELTLEEEWNHLQKAINTRSLRPQFIDGYGNTFISQIVFNEIKFGDGIKIACDTGRYGCKVRDSYRLPSGIHKILFELAVTFEDGTDGSVILPIVIDDDLYDYTHTAINPDQRTRGDVKWLSDYGAGGVIDSIKIISHRSSKSWQRSNPELEKLDTAIFVEGSRAQELLNKMYQLAADGKMLSQDEINELKDSLIWH